MAGFAYNPLKAQWSLTDDVGVNYIAYGTKNSEWRSEVVCQILWRLG